VRLVVTDSVTFHFRQDWPDAGLRSRLLAGLAQDAIALAEGRGLAVVFMNQVGRCGRHVGGGARDCGLGLCGPQRQGPAWCCDQPYPNHHRRKAASFAMGICAWHLEV
jgi:hypothetical protein